MIVGIYAEGSVNVHPVLRVCHTVVTGGLLIVRVCVGGGVSGFHRLALDFALDSSATIFGPGHVR